MWLAVWSSCLDFWLLMSSNLESSTEITPFIPWVLSRYFIRATEMKSEQKSSHWCLKVPKEGVTKLGLKPVCPPVSGASGRLMSWSHLSTVRIFMLLESSDFLPACLPLAYVCVYIHMCIHVCENQRLTLGLEFFFRTFPPCFWDRVWIWNSPIWLHWLTHKSQRSSCLCWDCRHAPMPGSLYGFWELNTGLHACIVSTLPTESPTPRVLGLFSCWHLTSV